MDESNNVAGGKANEPPAGSDSGCGIQLEYKLAELEKARKLKATIGRVGPLLLLIGLAVVVLNLWSVKSRLSAPDAQKEILASVVQDMGRLLSEDESLRELAREAREEIAPMVVRTITERLAEERPAFEEKAGQTLDNLRSHLEEDARARLADVLIDLLAMVEAKLIERYPQITADDLQATLEVAHRRFVEEAAVLVEAKLDIVADDLANLKETVERFKETAEYAELTEAMAVNRDAAIGKAQMAMVENMLELVIYHVNPDRGAELAIGKGGVQ